MGRRVNKLVSDVIVYLVVKKISHVKLTNIKSAISHVLCFPPEYSESVIIESSINSEEISIEEDSKKAREYIRKILIEVIKNHIKHRYTIDDFIAMKTDQKISLAKELTNWRTIFEALELEVIKKPLPGKKDIERLAVVLWGEKASNDAIKDYSFKNSSELKRKKIISEIKENYTLLDFIHSSDITLNGKSWVTVGSILGIKNNSGYLPIAKKYELANVVWNPKDVAIIRDYNEYKERPEVKEEMIIHAMKAQYSLDSFMSAQSKDLNKDKVKGYGWAAVCTILNLGPCNYIPSKEKREAIASKVWGNVTI